MTYRAVGVAELLPGVPCPDDEEDEEGEAGDED